MSKPSRKDVTHRMHPADQMNQVGPPRQPRSAVLRSLATMNRVAVHPQRSQSSSLGQKAILKKQAIREQFDRVILLVDLVGHVLDVEATLKQLRHCCTPTTRAVIAYYNFLWEPFLRLLERVGLKVPQDEQSWLSPADVRNLVRLADYEIVKVEWCLLMPMGIPILSTIANRLLAHLPGLNRLCLCRYAVARMRTAPSDNLQTVSLVIPCRNEKENIEAAMARLPSFGGHQEIIFVDGHSTDGTPDEIRRVTAQYPTKDIVLLAQDGTGKGDAVRKGFAHATGDILMILDADLTVPPEDLHKFYDAIASGKGEFINGSRLVYPMEHDLSHSCTQR